MKILERGTLPSEQVFRVSCRKCKSKLEFTAKEAKYESDWWKVDCPDWTIHFAQWKVDCPVCKQLVYAYRNDIVVKDSNEN